MRIVAIGEGMLELTGGLGEAARLTYGGDTLNTAIYLARLGHRPCYVSALGADAYSAELRAAWEGEGVDVAGVLTHPTRLPGLYAIRTDAQGERTFSYWRSESAARALFDCPGAPEILEWAAHADLLYLSGITLSLFDAEGRARLTACAAQVRARGGRVAFDPNYRPRGWPDKAAAIAAIDAVASFVSIALPTLDDEVALRGPASPECPAAWWRKAGADEVVVKLGPAGAFVSSAQGEAYVTQHDPVDAIDTTGAGDSFNAGYLAARLQEAGPNASVRAANALASRVVRHRGAIIPAAAMPARIVSEAIS